MTVDVWGFLAEDLRPPMEQEQYRLTWRNDLGANTPVGQVGAYLIAFQHAVDLGELWGLALAEEAAAQSVRTELISYYNARGDVDLTPLHGVMPWSQEKPTYMAVSRMASDPHSGDPVPDQIRRLSSAAVPELMGPGLRNERISYENPIEIIVGGAAFTMWGTVQVLRMVRDWSARRRMAGAAADMAESEARQAKTRTQVIEYLGREVVAGRLQIPPAQLAALVSAADLSALQALVGPEATLELPSSVASLLDDASDK